MKRFLVCVVALVLLFTLHTPVLAENKQFYCRRNDSLVVPMTVVENPNKLISADVKIQYDRNVFQLNQADAQDDVISLPMIISGIPARYPLDLPFQIRSDAPVGTYEITAQLVPGTGLDLNMNAADGLRLSSITVSVVDGPIIVDMQKESLFGSGTLPSNSDANGYDSPGRYALDATCTYYNLPITAGTLEVIRPSMDSSACTQIASSLDNSYTRTRVGSDWGPWMSAYDQSASSYVTGPAGSADGQVAVFDGSSGKALRAGSVIDNTGSAPVADSADLPTSRTILNSIYNGLDQSGAGFALDARQGQVLNDKIAAISGSFYNGLDRSEPGYALDAQQGKVLNDKIANLYSSIYNGLDQSGDGFVLDARQGKALNDKLAATPKVQTVIVGPNSTYATPFTADFMIAAWYNSEDVLIPVCVRNLDADFKVFNQNKKQIGTMRLFNNEVVNSTKLWMVCILIKSGVY